ncbi:MAG: YbhB/YbcL family Raf kinase inhibitor-like protein, partial [Patescibacteria group bacterium]|nr:YbhB/YbcL family Raf kinase inhibitor-like protein [Patescibacteria group bacterium]
MSKIAVIITILLVGVIMILGITKKQIIEPKTEINKETSMKIESPAFKNNGMIPSKYTCDGN